MNKRIPIHRRTIDFEAFDEGDSIEVRGRLRDERPWAAGTAAVEHVHDMELTVRVSKGSSTISEASATMTRYPHVECPEIADSFKGLVGLDIGRGYTREVQNKFGRENGCTHIETLARALGTVVVQAMTSCLAQSVLEGKIEDVMGSAVTSNPWALNTCHVWAEGGPAMAKLDAGWRPGKGPYPTPALVEIRRGVLDHKGTDCLASSQETNP